MERNDFKALPDELKPREQLRRAASPRDVSEESLLAILLKTGANGCDVVELARRLLKAFGSLHALVRADGRQLERTIKDYNRSHPEKRILGIGPVKALELTAAFELVRRGFEPKADDVRLRRVATSEDAYDVFKRGLALGDEQENFYVLPLDAKSHPLCEVVRTRRERTFLVICPLSASYPRRFRLGHTATSFAVQRRGSRDTPEPLMGQQADDGKGRG